MSTSGGPSAPKRFYQDVGVASAGDSNFRVTLDGRTMRTPAKREFALPTRPLAEAVAEEWRAQGTVILPASMPLTRIMNSAIDGVADRAPEVRESILAYGGSDLLCYLADGPRELIERQSRAWGPIHAWIKHSHDIELMLGSGVMPLAQDAGMLARLDGVLGDRSVPELAALSVITSSTGSLLLALAVLHDRLTAPDAWRAATIDEDYQTEMWGEDAEAARRRALVWADVEAASRLLSLVRS